MAANEYKICIGIGRDCRGQLVELSVNNAWLAVNFVTTCIFSNRAIHHNTFGLSVGMVVGNFKAKVIRRQRTSGYHNDLKVRRLERCKLVVSECFIPKYTGLSPLHIRDDIIEL